MGRRIRWLGAVLILCFALVLLQLLNVQYKRASSLANDPHNPRVIAAQYTQPRGTILAADGSTVLAESVPSHAGVYKYQRVYPQKSLFEQIVGYDSINYGLAGVEQEYNQYLSAHQLQRKTFDQLLHPVTGTDDVTLTVVPSLQLLAEQQLAGRDGAVVVLDPTTGAVEAMYSNPSIDPNGLASPYAKVEQLTRFAQLTPDSNKFAPISPLATQVPFAPGSTFKVVTTSAVYDYKPILANKSYPYVTGTPLPNSNKILNNDGGTACGGTIVEMLPQSCDPGYGLLGIDLGGPTLSKQAVGFGFNRVPPFDVPGTVASTFPSAIVSKPTNQAFLAYSAIGQFDDKATALQMALVASGIADGGVIMTPHVMAQIYDSQGNLVTAYQPTPWVRAATQKAAAQVTPLMESVVTSGTASGVGFLPQDQVAAKTGTAQQSQNSATQALNATDDWMIAFAPASNPRVAVAVVVPYQALSAYGATVAGPIVKAMIEAALAAPGAPSATPTPST